MKSYIPDYSNDITDYGNDVSGLRVSCRWSGNHYLGTVISRSTNKNINGDSVYLIKLDDNTALIKYPGAITKNEEDPSLTMWFGGLLTVVGKYDVTAEIDNRVVLKRKCAWL